jgi:UDP-N-acetylglucosamine--N-acetylmuramyl-(pentapeptide) pyrophosphoryl-undecaprenol N-acetylglucosamine transferase
MHEPRTVMLAAGGTGGHLFPAYALAEELGRRGYAVDLITDMRGDRYGTGFPARRIHQVPAATLASKSPLAITKTALTLSRGVAAALRIIGEVKPAAIVGFGGYPTFPPLIAARMRGIPSALHEQNAILGRANRMLAKRVDAIATSFETTRLLDGALAARSRYTGNPVRDAVAANASVAYESLRPGERVKVLVFGGSQGARFFSDTVPAAVALMPDELRRRLGIVQQAREEDVARVRTAYVEFGVAAEVAPFFNRLPEIMAASHLVIGRAGASTVAELTVIGRPAILVPLPHSLDNDQLQNATRLAESGGAWCIEQKNLTPERLAAELAALIAEPARLAAAAAAAKSQGRPDAVQRLAGLVEDLVAGRVRAGTNRKGN